MKIKLYHIITLGIFLLNPLSDFAQAPYLGSAANFVIFSTNGPLNNTGTSPLTGDIGTNNGTSSNYLNVIGSIHDQDGASALCATDLLAAYNQINNTASTLIAVSTIGNGQVLTPGAYRILGNASLNNTLVLNGQNNVNAVFIIKIYGAFASNPGAVVMLTNGASACNVFWAIEGALSLAAGTLMKGTLIANNGAISISSGVNLQGRALSTTGAITTDNMIANIPTGCITQSTGITSQPTSQTVCAGSAVSFSIAAGGSGLTYQWRKGTVNLVNNASISGATSAVLTINGLSAADATSDYNVVISGSAPGPITSNNISLAINAVPVITGQPANQIGCVDYSSVRFTVSATGTGLTYQWRRGTTNIVDGGNVTGATTGTLTILPMFLPDTANNYNVVVSGACLPSVTSANASLKLCGNVQIAAQENTTKSMIFYPNPFKGSVEITSTDAALANNPEVIIYNILGVQMMKFMPTRNLTKIPTSNFPEGVYFYQVSANDKILQTGKLVSE